MPLSFATPGTFTHNIHVDEWSFWLTVHLAVSRISLLNEKVSGLLVGLFSKGVVEYREFPTVVAIIRHLPRHWPWRRSAPEFGQNVTLPRIAHHNSPITYC